MAQANPLDVEAISVEYTGGFRALDSVSLYVAPGEIVGVLGPSGSGKSTLLRAVAGLEKLASGRVVMGGEDMAGVPTHLRPCTMVFQDGQLFPHRTVGGNISYGMDRRISRGVRAERVNALLDVVGLAGFADRRIETLSGGQAQRVALARSLARESGLVLFDEPLSALDADLRVQLGADVRDILQRSGTSALYVTHDEAEAGRMADRIIRLDEGGRAQPDKKLS